MQVLSQAPDHFRRAGRWWQELRFKVTQCLLVNGTDVMRAFAVKAGFDVVGVWEETASGAKDDRAQRKKVMALAQARDVDVVLVTELTRWGRSTIDLFHTLGEF